MITNYLPIITIYTGFDITQLLLAFVLFAVFFILLITLRRS